LPTYSYKCSKHGTFDVFFTSFSKAEPFINGHSCPECLKDVKIEGEFVFKSPRAIEMTLEPHFYGSPLGYAKPSPAGRHSYKLISAEGN
jgi:hypothetical protein